MEEKLGKETEWAPHLQVPHVMLNRKYDRKYSLHIS